MTDHNHEQELEIRIRELRHRIRELEKQLELPLLQGKDEIMDYCHMSEYMLKKWIKMGLPVLIVDGTWYAYKDNIKDYFRASTRVNSSKAPDINS